MKENKLEGLTLRARDFNLVAQKPELLKKLRSLTISSYSGMNYELNNFEKIIKIRPVNCQVLTAHKNREIVAWALLSKESSHFTFAKHFDGFDPRYGSLFEVYVHPDFRRMGIASRLLKLAKRKTIGERLCVCPHDSKSDTFYSKFSKYNPRLM